MTTMSMKLRRWRWHLTLTVLLAMFSAPPAFADWTKWNTEGFRILESPIKPDADNVLLKIVCCQHDDEWDWFEEGKIYAVYDNGSTEQIGSLKYKGKLSIESEYGWVNQTQNEAPFPGKNDNKDHGGMDV